MRDGAFSGIMVGIGDCRSSCDTGAYLATHALGSCMAVGIYDSEIRAGAMLHFMLPDSSMDRQMASVQPALFADTGIALLFEQMKALGAEKARLKVHLAGGAQVVSTSAAQHIGKRNYLAARKNLWKLGLLVDGEAAGGVVARNLVLAIASGEFVVRTA